MHSRKPTRPIQLIAIVLAGLILPVPATAAFTISSVSNFASRIPTGFTSYGIAQGAAFAVVGAGVGQDPPTQATFPLPTSLNGVSIKVAVGSSSVDAIMLFVSANEIDAILPSGTSVGTGTITVTNGSDSAKAQITVVTAAFGIATTFPGGADRRWHSRLPTTGPRLSSVRRTRRSLARR